MYTTHKPFTKKQAIVLFSTSLLPLFIYILNSIYIFYMGGVWFTNIIYGFILPMLFVFLNYCILRTDKRTVSKIFIWMFVFIMYICITFLAFKIHNVSKNSYQDNKAIEQYSASFWNDYFPVVSTAGNYQSIEYHYIETWKGNANEDWLNSILIFQYEPEEYAHVKSNIQSTYHFEEGNWSGEYNNLLTTTDYTVLPECSIYDYNFQMLETHNYYRVKTESGSYSYFHYPSRLGFIITNDKTHEIGFLFTRLNGCDLSKEYITSTKKFINNTCGWKFIR